MTARKSTAKAKPDAFTAHVLKAKALASKDELAAALGKLTVAKATKRAALRQSPLGRHVYQPGTRTPYPATPAKRRASPRRLGKAKAYTPTYARNSARRGSFRHYMIELIKAHSDTLSATEAHAKCDNPSWAKNKIDFNWAADNGFLNWA